MCSNDEDNSLFLVFQSHHLKCEYKFYFHCIFNVYFILFCVNDSVGLTKKTLFLHDFYVMRPLFWLSTIAQEANKVLQGGVSLPFIGSLCVYGNSGVISVVDEPPHKRSSTPC